LLDLFQGLLIALAPLQFNDFPVENLHSMFLAVRAETPPVHLYATLNIGVTKEFGIPLFSVIIPIFKKSLLSAISRLQTFDVLPLLLKRSLVFIRTEDYSHS
jgi:hypothetical protein